MAKPKDKITKDEMQNIIRSARRAVDVEAGIGVNLKRQVFTDKKKKDNKSFCRSRTD